MSTALVEHTDIKPPKGARVHILEVEVEQNCEWQSAVNAAGPNTPGDYNIRKVGDQYPPIGKEKEKVKEKLILLNFPNGGGSWNQAIMWAKTKGLKRTHPRETFAIGEQHPKLHVQLGQDPMFAVATTDCSFEGDRSACCVWWCDSRRGASLALVGDFGGAVHWSVFRM